MTSAVLDGDEVKLRLSKSEALVLFEWLSRNWESTHWENEDLFSDPAEKQLLMWLEADLASILPEPFEARYRQIVEHSYRDVVPNAEEW